MQRDQTREIENRKGGFTLLEVMVAIAILTVGVLGVATMQGSAIRANNRGYRLTEAATLAQDRLEFLLSQSYSADPLLTADTDKSDPRGATPSGYTIEYDVTDIRVNCVAPAPYNAKLIEIRVLDTQNREVVLEYIRADMQGA